VTSSRSPRFRDSLRAVRIRLLISGVGCWDASPDRSMKHPAPGVCRRCWDCKRLAVHTLHPDTTETRMQRLLKATASLRGSFRPFLSLPPSLSLSLSPPSPLQEKGGKWRALLIVHATVSRRCKCARLSRAAKYTRTLKSIMRSPCLCLSGSTIAKMRALTRSSFH